MKSVVDRNRTYTIEEYLALPDDNHRYELVNGRLVEKDGGVETEYYGPDARHGMISANLSYYLCRYLLSRPLGIGMIGTAFIMDTAQRQVVREADLAFLSAERVAKVNLDEAINGAPDLAIEIISSRDTWSDTNERIHDYQTAGTRLIWIINPFGKAVFVHRGESNKVQVVNRDEELDGEDVIEGFKLRVGLLFE